MKPFKIYRYFAITSAAAVVLSTIVAGAILQRTLVHDFLIAIEDHNVLLARSLANVMLNRHAGFLMRAATQDVETLKSSEEIARIDRMLRRLVANLNVLRAKIYDSNGRTIYSSEMTQIGEVTKHEHASHVTLRDGRSLSKFSTKDHFSAFSGEVFGRDLIETYVPIRKEGSDPIAVFEIYTDVTKLGELLNTIIFGMIGVLLVVSCLLYAVLVLVVMPRAMKPLQRASMEAERIDPSMPGRRLPINGMPEEVMPLVSAVNEALQRLEHALLAQRQFAADAAHELLTPLAVLRAHLDTLPDRTMAKDLAVDVSPMVEIIEQLLTLEEMDANDAGEGERVNIQEVAENVVATMAPLVVQQGKSIALVERSDAVTVYCPSKAYARALQNLIKNAVLHTPKGTKITVMVGRDGSLSVEDDGPGVPVPLQGKLFDRFWRGGDKNLPGAGLGLSIVKRFAETYHGTVVYEAPSGGGSRFTLRLPVI